MKAAMNTGVTESKLKAHYHHRVVCPSCLHTACNTMYFFREAAVHTTSKRQKQNAIKCDSECTHYAQNVILICQTSNQVAQTFESALSVVLL